MSPQSTANTSQHYVPQLLLRGFCFDDAHRIYVLDKTNCRVFPSTVRDVASEQGFYNHKGTANLDLAMTRIEGAIAPTIRKIIAERSVAKLTMEERTFLAGFTTMQMIRTRAYLERRYDLGQQLINAVASSMKIEVPEDWKVQLSKESQRDSVWSSMPSTTADYMKHMLVKSLILFQSDSSLPFWISDNPVVLNNSTNTGHGVRSTLGLAVKGIEIYMPINHKFTIGYLCPSIADNYEKLQADVARFGFISYPAHTYLLAGRTGRPLLLNKDNVRFNNSLQVANSERFVFSPAENFEEAIDIIRQAPETRRGSRFVIGE